MAEIVKDAAGTTLLTGETSVAKSVVGNFVPEILEGIGQHAGPYVQIEGYGGDATISDATCDGTATDWSGKIVYDGRPIEGPWSDITLSSGSLLAYKRRA